jgi:hypothetical protein
MKVSESPLSKMADRYRTFCVVLFNSFLLFVIINALSGAYLGWKHASGSNSVNAKSFMAHRTYDPSLAYVYPDMTESQITQLIKETRKLTQEYDPYTQFKERSANGKYVNVDSNGFRNIKDQGPWPPDKKSFNIFVFGGSTTFGYRVADDGTIASHLQEIIRKETHLKATVYNFGRAGYIASQERILFEKLILKGYVPNIAIFVDGLNDLKLCDGEPLHTPSLREFMDQGEISLRDRIIMELPLVKLLFSPSRRSGDTGQKTEDVNERSDEINKTIESVVDRYLANKKIITATALAYGVAPVFVWQPVPVYEYDHEHHIFNNFDYACYMPHLAPGYRLMAERNRSGAMGGDFVWCADVQKDSKKPLYADAVHYSSEMNLMIARRIFENLQGRNLSVR